MDGEKKFVGSIYIQHEDSGRFRWRSSHTRKNSWTNLAAQEIATGHVRFPSSSSSAQPLRLLSIANPKKAAEARALQQSQSALAGVAPSRSLSKNSPATPDASQKSRRKPSKLRPPSATKQASHASSALKPVVRIPTVSARDNMDEVMHICRTAKKMHIPAATAKQAADFFKEFGDVECLSSITHWRMSKAQFVKVLYKLADQCAKKTSLDKELLESSFFDADVSRRGWLDFENLAFWLSNNSFSEEINVDDEQRELRSLARKYDMHLCSVEKHKKDFERYDMNKRGAIGWEEFESVIHKCAKVPGKLRLPVSRIRQFWQAADQDSDGMIDFEEFLAFQKKYFDTDGNSAGSRNGIEDFYRDVRKHCWN